MDIDTLFKNLREKLNCHKKRPHFSEEHILAILEIPIVYGHVWINTVELYHAFYRIDSEIDCNSIIKLVALHNLLFHSTIDIHIIMV